MESMQIPRGRLEENNLARVPDAAVIVIRMEESANESLEADLLKWGPSIFKLPLAGQNDGPTTNNVAWQNILLKFFLIIRNSARPIAVIIKQNRVRCHS